MLRPCPDHAAVRSPTGCVLADLPGNLTLDIVAGSIYSRGDRVMITAESTALLQQARTVLERYLFDGVDLRDDVAEICARIDAALPPAPEIHQPRKLEGIERAA